MMRACEHLIIHYLKKVSSQVFRIVSIFLAHYMQHFQIIKLTFQ
jgi:hypothetical protein